MYQWKTIIQNHKTAQKSAMTHLEEMIVAKNIKGSNNLRNLPADKDQQIFGFTE